LQVKRIGTERPNGKKLIMAEADCEPCLFGWQAMDAKARAVVLCEGEIDCMTYSQFGISALSVPFGGGKGPNSNGSNTSITTSTDSKKFG
jgi:twinkle protein